jgi:hypothetical protein
MHVRKLLALAGITAVIAIPVAAAGSSNTVVATADGRYHWTIPLPNAFGVEVKIPNHSFQVRKRADGSVTGRFKHHQVVEGESFKFEFEATCMGIYDNGHRAKIGGVVTASNDPTVPVGTFGWFQTFDRGDDEGGNDESPGWSSLVGFGDEAANEAFCNSPNLPRFGPWDVQGELDVELEEPDSDD